MPRDDTGREPVSVGEAMVVRGSPKALCVELVDHGRELWIPRSVIHDDSEVYDDDGEHDNGELVLLRWFAEKEQLA